MIQHTLLRPELDQVIADIFGDSTDSMERVEQRAQERLPNERLIVWEGDATNFQFLFVSPSAERVLGYPIKRWLTEPTFWCDTIVHPQDRNDAISYCALATGQGRDHDFIYRAIRVDGSVIWLHDVVKVVFGKLGVAARLRGIMLVIPPPESATEADEVEQ